LKNFPISYYLLEVILTQCRLHAHCTPSFPLQFVDIRNFVHSWNAADYHLNALSAQWALGSVSCKLLIYRYKNELSEEDKEKLRHLMRQHKHYLVFAVKFLCDVLKGIVIIQFQCSASLNGLLYDIGSWWCLVGVMAVDHHFHLWVRLIRSWLHSFLFCCQCCCGFFSATS
jgi:hypothetical protein